MAVCVRSLLSDFKALNFDLLFSAFPGNQFYDGYLHEDAIGNVLQGMVLRWHCFMAAMGGGVSGSMRVSNWRPILLPAQIRQRSRGINLVLVTRWESSGPYMTFVKMEHASLTESWIRTFMVYSHWLGPEPGQGPGPVLWSMFHTAQG